MADHKLKIGDIAPDFDLLADDGKHVKLSDLRGKKVVIYFYPKDDTPGCTIQSCGLRDNYGAIEQANSIVLGISPDDQASHQSFKTKFSLPFPLLVDDGHKVADAYGVWGERTFGERTTMGNLRSHFIVDEKGTLADVQYEVSPQDSISRAVASVTG